ncbi:hypothetical protein SPHV1_410042 [Novosphingobium sp. KN65.2]|nr:hypothetical protein SPHV1_410042 [Novosphingobium sp. KN65.2]
MDPCGSSPHGEQGVCRLTGSRCWVRECRSHKMSWEPVPATGQKKKHDEWEERGQEDAVPMPRQGQTGVSTPGRLPQTVCNVQSPRERTLFRLGIKGLANTFAHSN